MAGYSGTPLPKKLGIKEGSRVGVVNMPKNFLRELQPLPENVSIATEDLVKPLDLIVLFVDSQRKLKATFNTFAKKLTPNGALWVSWPKRTSGISTDLSDNSVREIGLDKGLVDIKVCAVNEIWSGLKFVYRLKDR